jgi:tRNA G18 (ribose-2'-O)-methylase SpoU
LAQKTDRAIAKTAIGAEQSVDWRHAMNVAGVIKDLKGAGCTIAALEQLADAVQLPDYQPPDKLALLVGHEVEGIEPEVLALCDLALEIPMFGQKESFNVVQAAAMALYHLRFML